MLLLLRAIIEMSREEFAKGKIDFGERDHFADVGKMIGGIISSALTGRLSCQNNLLKVIPLPVFKSGLQFSCVPEYQILVYIRLT